MNKLKAVLFNCVEQLKKYFSLIFSFGISPILGLLTGMLTSRMLGPDGRGELAAIQMMASFIVIIAYFGMAPAITFFSAKAPQDSGRVLGSALAIGLGISIPLLIAGNLIIDLILWHYSTPVIAAAKIFLLFVPLNILNAMPWSTFQGLQKFWIFSLLRVQPQFCYLCLIVAFWLLNLYSPILIAYGSLASIVLICVPTTWYVYRRWISQKLEVKKDNITQLLPYGFYSLLSALPSSLSQRVDQLFIANILSPADLGIYAISVSYSLTILPFSSVVSSIVLPKASILHSSLKNKFELTIIIRSMIAIFIVAGVWTSLASFLVPLLFGPDFYSAVVVSQVLSVAASFYSINSILEELLRADNKPALGAFAEIVGLLITVLGLSLFLPKYGLISAAVVSMVSYAIVTLILLYILFRIRTARV